MFDKYETSSGGHFAVIGSIGLLLGVAAVVWILFQSLVYEVYVLFTGTATIVAVLRWPKPEWLGLSQSAAAKRSWGRVQPKKTRTCFSRVSELTNVPAVSNYFAAEVRIADTHKLCEEVWETAIQKGIAYVVLIIALLVIVPHPTSHAGGTAATQAGETAAASAKEPSSAPDWGDVTKALGIFAAFAVVAVWDVAKCVLQFNRNMGLSHLPASAEQEESHV